MSVNESVNYVRVFINVMKKKFFITLVLKVNRLSVAGQLEQ